MVHLFFQACCYICLLCLRIYLTIYPRLRHPSQPTWVTNLTATLTLMSNMSRTPLPGGMSTASRFHIYRVWLLITWQYLVSLTSHSVIKACSDTKFTATSVDVERLFSCGRLLLSHVHSRLSAQSTWALLCLGYWSRLKLVKTEDVMKVSALPDVKGNEEEELDDGWDSIEI